MRILHGRPMNATIWLGAGECQRFVGRVGMVIRPSADDEMGVVLGLSSVALVRQRSCSLRPRRRRLCANQSIRGRDERIDARRHLGDDGAGAVLDDDGYALPHRSKHQTEAAWPRHARVHFHWRRDKPNALSERSQRFLGEGDLHRRQVDAPELTCAAFREVAQRVTAAAAELEGGGGRGLARAGGACLRSARAARTRERGTTVEDRRHSVPPRTVDRERSFGVDREPNDRYLGLSP